MEQHNTNMFAGMSSLRAQERARQPPSEQAKALQAYLKKYTDDGPLKDAQSKKKRKKKISEAPTGVRIIDEDHTGLRSIPVASARLRTEEEEASPDDAPVIANPGEADLYARLLEKERASGVLHGWAPASEVGIETSDDRPSKQRKRVRHDSPNASPPPQPLDSSQQQRHSSPDMSPPRRAGHDEPDASPPRRVRHDSPDASPPRRVRHDSPDASPSMRVRISSPDASPPRRRHKPPSVSDASPPRRSDKAPSKQHTERRVPTRSPPQKGVRHGQTLASGVSAGIATKEALTEQLKSKQAADRQRLAEAASSSRHAETIYRDKATGQRMTKTEFEAAQRKNERSQPKYEAPEWGGGVKQIRDREEQAAAMRKEASREFARTRDDVDEDLNLKDRARFGDPMAHLVKRKAEAPLPSAIPQNLAKQMKSGFIIPQEVPAHSWLKRGMGAPPNRYNIKPGRHWDGVDRSTGFERDMFKQQAARAALEREARMWAQSDM